MGETGSRHSAAANRPNTWNPHDYHEGPVSARGGRPLSPSRPPGGQAYHPPASHAWFPPTSHAHQQPVPESIYEQVPGEQDAFYTQPHPSSSRHYSPSRGRGALPYPPAPAHQTFPPEHLNPLAFQSLPFQAFQPGPQQPHLSHAAQGMSHHYPERPDEPRCAGSQQPHPHSAMRYHSPERPGLHMPPPQNPHASLPPTSPRPGMGLPLSPRLPLDRQLSGVPDPVLQQYAPLVDAGSFWGGLPDPRLQPQQQQQNLVWGVPHLGGPNLGLPPMGPVPGMWKAPGLPHGGPHMMPPGAHPMSPQNGYFPTGASGHFPPGFAGANRQFPPGSVGPNGHFPPGFVDATRHFPPGAMEPNGHFSPGPPVPASPFPVALDEDVLTFEEVEALSLRVKQVLQHCTAKLKASPGGEHDSRNVFAQRLTEAEDGFQRMGHDFRTMEEELKHVRATLLAGGNLSPHARSKLMEAMERDNRTGDGHANGRISRGQGRIAARAHTPRSDNVSDRGSEIWTGGDAPAADSSALVAILAAAGRSSQTDAILEASGRAIGGGMFSQSTLGATAHTTSMSMSMPSGGLAAEEPCLESVASRCSVLEQQIAGLGLGAGRARAMTTAVASSAARAGSGERRQTWAPNALGDGHGHAEVDHHCHLAIGDHAGMPVLPMEGTPVIGDALVEDLRPNNVLHHLLEEQLHHRSPRRHHTLPTTASLPPPLSPFSDSGGDPLSMESGRRLRANTSVGSGRF